jgi:hypothetical protein
MMTSLGGQQAEESPWVVFQLKYPYLKDYVDVIEKAHEKSSVRNKS